MNKLMRNCLLITALAVVSNVQADGDSHNQTFLNPRSHGVNLALENVNGWQKLIHRKGADDTFGGNFQVIGYYMASTDEDELGEYFAPETSPAANTLRDNRFNFGSVANATNNGNTVADQTLNFRQFVHQAAELANLGELVKVNLQPEQRAYGVHLNYHQDLDKILKGLYFKINVPIVNVENSIDPEFTAGAVTPALADVSGTVPTALAALQGYFNGSFSNTNAVNAQEALKFLKFGANNNEDSSTGVADIDFILGYYFLYTNKYRLAVNLGVTIPTGDDADSNKLFEAIVGNGDHWAFGAGLDGGATMWQNGDHSLTFHSAINYRYLFEGTERRTLGLKDAAGKIIPYGHYKLLGQSNGAAAPSTLIPAANKLTVNCDVTPGSQLDMIVAFAYHCCGFTFDLGYNLFFREEEDVDRKGAIFGELVNAAGAWGIVHANRNVAGGIANDGSHFVEAITDSKNVTTDNAQTPDQLTHKIYAGLSYATYSWDVPLFVGLHGHYEWASDNSGISNWGIGGKAGVAF
ncbi:hypothetical protein K2W90_03605 [Candidatus Babeliales bacterium]|nr:hypothetical protein [Candidatus Babeliales bacterium]